MTIFSQVLSNTSFDSLIISGPKNGVNISKSDQKLFSIAVFLKARIIHEMMSSLDRSLATPQKRKQLLCAAFKSGFLILMLMLLTAQLHHKNDHKINFGLSEMTRKPPFLALNCSFFLLKSSSEDSKNDVLFAISSTLALKGSGRKIINFCRFILDGMMA